MISGVPAGVHGLGQSSLECPQLIGVLPAFKAASQVMGQISPLFGGKVFLGDLQPTASAFV
jgi:hypothetical protein